MRQSLDLDPDLPRLPLIDDREAVGALLAPGATVLDVQRQDTKYEPGIRCVAAYQIATDATRPPLLGAVVVTPSEVDAFLASHDLALPHLAAALDGEAVGEARRFPGESAGRLTGCRATAVRYKPGVRCTVRYDLDGSVRSAVHFAKMLAGDPARPAALIDRLRLGLGTGDDAPQLPPVAVWADLQMVVQAAEPHAREVHGFVGDRRADLSKRREMARRIGTALAAVHLVPPLPEAPARSFADDLDELRSLLPGLRLADTTLGERFQSILDRLATGDGDSAAPVTSHGAFRTDQLMVSGDDLVLIDLDTICRAEPARDIGNLLAYLDWKAIRSPEDETALAELAASFLDGYADRLALPPASRIAAQRAACLVKIAGRRIRSLTVTEWAMLPSLLDAADRQLRVHTTHTLEPT